MILILSQTGDRGQLLNRLGLGCNKIVMDFLTNIWRKVQRIVSSPQTVMLTEADKEEIKESIKPFRMKIHHKPLRNQDLNDTSDIGGDSPVASNANKQQSAIGQQQRKERQAEEKFASFLNSLDSNAPVKVPPTAEEAALEETVKEYESLASEINNITLHLIPQVQESFSSIQTDIEASILRVDKQLSELNKHSRDERAEKSLARLNRRLYKYQIEYPTLKSQQLSEVKHIFKNSSFESTELPRINPINSITYKSFCSLSKGRWLNDEVINTYIDMIKREIGSSEFNIMNTYFSVQLNTQNLDRFINKYKINANQKLVVPVHWNSNHWMFVTIIEGVIKLYDSMKNTDIPDILFDLSMKIHQKADLEVQKYPKQKGYEDCGVYMLCGIKAICCNFQCWGFSQTSIYYKRLCIGRDILQGQIGRVSPPEISHEIEESDNSMGNLPSQESD